MVISLCIYVIGGQRWHFEEGKNLLSAWTWAT